MRLWTLHPRYLDARGLIALWREGLLAQAVLRGRTKGYRHHPQLMRFSERERPVSLIAGYLQIVRLEAVERGYRFDRSRLARCSAVVPMVVTKGQLEFEWEHLLAKVRARDPEWFTMLARVPRPQAHPLFRTVRGGVAEWERGHAARTS